jgi:hypothetical protein
MMDVVFLCPQCDTAVLIDDRYYGTTAKCCELYIELFRAGRASICEKCRKPILDGDWPFCPHPKAGSSMIQQDEIPGGVIVENYGPHPIRFDSHSERRAYMKAHGLQEKEKFCPSPGTDIDPQGIPNPAGYVDDMTMRNRAELFLRGNNRHVQESPDPTVTTGEMSHEEALDYARHTMDS